MMWYDEPHICISTEMGPMPREWLIPNGKRYELREISKPEHPETLATAEDYKNAPIGTIVEESYCSPFMKNGADIWANTFNDTFSKEEMAGTPRKVLRWGWGES